MKVKNFFQWIKAFCKDWHISKISEVGLNNLHVTYNQSKLFVTKQQTCTKSIFSNSTCKVELSKKKLPVRENNQLVYWEIAKTIPDIHKSGRQN